MFRKLILLFCVALFPATASSAPVWPMHAGEIWEYTATPLDGGTPRTAKWNL